MDFYSTYSSDRSQQINYNNPGFPVAIRIEHLGARPDFADMNRWHDEMEFLYVQSGEMTCSIEGTQLSLSAGQGLFINCHRMHYFYNEEKNDCHYITVLFHPSLLSANDSFFSKYVRPFAMSAAKAYTVLTPEIPWQNEILMEIQQLFENRTQNYLEFSVQIIYMRIFAVMNCQWKVEEAAISDSINLSTVKSMILFIQENYKNKITLDEISASGGCCKSKCSELFKTYLNTSPVNYLTDYRMTLSLKQLEETDNNIQEIATECGFNGSNYFCETFKKHFDISPAEYRKNLRATKDADSRQDSDITAANI